MRRKRAPVTEPTFIMAIELQNPLLDPNRRLEIRLAFASMVLRDLRKWRRSVVPSRPAELPDDVMLVQEVRAARSRPRPSKPAKELLETFGAYRYAIMRAESDDASRLLVLAETARTYADVGDPASLERVCAYAREEYGVAWPPVPALDQEGRVAALAVSRAREMPEWVRQTWDPPREGNPAGVPVGDPIEVDPEQFKDEEARR